ncbi:hypothetical protein [Arthrospiribacter ruber]|uniref:Uncharacterized protein n=1 Tax=Arthrospiribacter ruber TaxID=2487934 RepID=A0A951IXN7_9BACT|nr:hypothetical protein [Arthrospiribacter ruber]MBW3469085.1 hypothetical protein [Arthrospiribacter ruber]
MEVVNNRLIINQKRSEPINIIIELDSEELDFNFYDSFKSEIRVTNSFRGTVIYSPVVTLEEDNQLNFFIPSSVIEGFPRKTFFDIKAINGEDVKVLIEGEISITDNTTKIY